MITVWSLLVYVILPLWVIAGFLDYLCHRAGDIEHATGIRESLLHWLMIMEVAVPLLLAVFFRINALLLLLMIVSLVVHEVTGYMDLKVAMATRKVSIFEHQVRSVLEVLPFTAMVLVMALHWPQAQALFGLGHETADFSLRPKQLTGWGELGPPATAFLVLVLAPYAEELWRADGRGRYGPTHHEFATKQEMR